MEVWEALETVVLGYFTTRGVCPRACQDIIIMKGGAYKSILSIQAKIEDARRIHGLWDAKTAKWNMNDVDAWLHSFKLKDIHAATAFGGVEEQMIAAFHRLDFHEVRTTIWNYPIIPISSPKIRLSPQRDLGACELDYLDDGCSYAELLAISGDVSLDDLCFGLSSWRFG